MNPPSAEKRPFVHVGGFSALHSDVEEDVGQEKSGRESEECKLLRQSSLGKLLVLLQPRRACFQFKSLSAPLKADRSTPTFRALGRADAECAAVAFSTGVPCLMYGEGAEKIRMERAGN